MLLIDARNRIVYCTRAARAMFGYSIREIWGRPITTVLPDAFPAACERIAAHDNPKEKTIAGVTFESRGFKKDGTVIVVELTVAVWKRGFYYR
jgi:PAS domain S-box-containing protein